MGSSCSSIQFESAKPNQKTLYNQWITPDDVDSLSL